MPTSIGVSARPVGCHTILGIVALRVEADAPLFSFVLVEDNRKIRGQLKDAGEIP